MTAAMSAAMRLVAGIDEVGRGCLAGPVYAAAVVLPDGHGLLGLRDSKKLSAAQREKLAPQIRARATAWAIGVAEVDEIDRINILRATFLAMRRAVDALPLKPDECWVDGSQRPELPAPVRMIVGGDGSEPSIMAASILAKVARDAQMDGLHVQHPLYGWNRNKGYGTAEHLSALRQHGLTPWHRRSFAPCAQQIDTSATGRLQRRIAP